MLGLISLISPIEYTGEFKPYLTVHDPSYKTIQETYEKKGIDNIVIGVTNPLFLKVRMINWKHKKTWLHYQ